jgi:hypothetical protein
MLEGNFSLKLLTLELKILGVNDKYCKKILIIIGFISQKEVVLQIVD